MLNQNVALSNEQIQQFAPSAFAGQPYARQSERYAFVPTSAVIDGLRQAGFFPVKASQSICRIADKKPFTKHMIRFRSADQQITNVGDSAIETVLVNSHDGSSSYELSLGVFRLVCTNGLMVADGLVSAVKIRHTGNIIDRVIEESEALLKNAPKVTETIQAWRGIQLLPREAQILAEEAHSLRFADNDNLADAIKPDALLRPRRYDDQNNDLWTVFNRVQENTVRGGIRGIRINDNHRVRRVRSREVKGIDQNIRLNRALWSLVEKMAELKQAA